jgi:DNA modification methylase
MTHPSPTAVRVHDQIETLALDALVPYARNSRTHSAEQIAQIAASIREFGFTNPVLIDDAGGIIAGHGRVLGARAVGLAAVPCLRLVGLSAAQKSAYVIADNKLALNAGWDDALLALEMRDLQGMDFDLGLLGFDTSEIDQLLAGLDATPEGDTDADDVPEPPAAPVSRLGDVWLLGKHRLMCGDSAKSKDVATLMAGAKACLMVTDPPYGVAYVGKTKDALTVENDDVDSATLKTMCTDWFDNANLALQDGAYVLATVPAGPLHLIFAGDWLDRGWLRQIMVWNKDSMVLGHSEYHYKHEPILFGWKPGKRLVNSDRTKTTVWDFKRPKRSTEHPTMKPVEMWCYAITQHSEQGGGLYEPFSGSGTSIMAAQQTGRICYAMELSPQYVDVAVTRWQNYTGQRATLEATGEPFPLEPVASK